MKSYHQIEDLLSDKSFKDWVLKGDVIQQIIWEKWQTENPDKVEMLKHARTILLDLDRDGSDWNVKRQGFLFSKIRARINSKGKNASIPVYSPYRSATDKWARVVIVTLLLLVSFAALVKVDFSGQDDPLIGLEEKKEVWITKSNPRGQKSTIHLPDGSTLVLNSESAIRFRNNFGKDHRDIYLEGESFFEVAPDSLLPFRVFSRDLVTIALGTSFNINSYKKGHVQVQLATGKVMVFQDKKEDKPLFLIPGEEVSLTEGEEMSKRKFDHRKAFLWKEGTLWFDETPLSEVIPTLERWYGVQVEVKNWPQGGKLISGEFTDTYLSDVLESLGYAYGFDYQINNKAVKINFTQNEDI